MNKKQLEKTKENRSQKAKCDLIAELIEKKDLRWTHKNIDNAFVFLIDEISISVFHDNIILKSGILKSELNDEKFWRNVEDVLENKKQI